MDADLRAKFGLDRVAFEGLEHRARIAAMLRAIVADGCVEVTISMSAKTALRLADDVEFAVTSHPLGVPPSSARL